MLIPSASDYAISLISSLCLWDPLKRPTAAKALQHPFFKPFSSETSDKFERCRED
ncbi:Serine/threonine-protein kinase MHK [Trichinella patagoniensis]|uniref:Serine/threonine-protein kinase MHK n=1 Tax=Trichinella patagoniensis TaxID=990121 RepID=A0A0V0XK24_9BILA|nr:Serine/threonine-protein kinase MHK [Trichinella patagoniensis]